MSKTNKIVLIGLSIIIFGLSTVPRFVNAGRFLPFYSIDENEVVEYSVALMGEDKAPKWQKYGPLNWYLLGFVYDIQASMSENPDEYLQKVFFDNKSFYTTARILSSLFNVGMSVFAFLMVWKFFDRTLAFYVLPVLAFPFSDILAGYYARVDALLGFCTIAGLFFLMNYFHTRKFWNIILSGVFIGLSIATKPLPGLLSFPTIFLAFVLDTMFNENKDEKSTGIIQAVLAALKTKEPYILLVSIILGLFIGFPDAILEYSSFIDQQLLTIKDDSGYGWKKGYEISRFFPLLGYGFTLIGGVALIYSLIKYRKNVFYFIILSYPAVFFLIFVNKPARHYFYMPIMVLIAIAIIIMAIDLSKKLNRGVLVVILLLVLVQPTYLLIKRISEEGIAPTGEKNHTGIVATKWCEENIPDKSKVILYGYYTILPKLVAANPQTAGTVGEYFMYYRGSYKFYVDLFNDAYSSYMESEKPSYDLMNLRYDLKEQEPGLYGYCMQNKYQYVISTKNLGIYPQFASKQVSFYKKGRKYPFGNDVYIYKLF